MANINKSYTPKMREEWTEIYTSKPIWQNNLLEQEMFHEGDKGGWFNYILW